MECGIKYQKKKKKKRKEQNLGFGVILRNKIYVPDFPKTWIFLIFCVFYLQEIIPWHMQVLWHPQHGVKVAQNSRQSK